jgi:hypothetical protein
MSSKHKIIKDICLALSKGEENEAREIITCKYPFAPKKKKSRRYSDEQKLRVFKRDGFIDQYSGEKLVFPPVLRLLSILFPEEFPYHSHWKTTECHMAYWHLFPTIDHIVPVSRGGDDTEENWVCTSQLKNGVKANWLLEEIGWELKPPGRLEEWDGLLSWFVEYMENHEELSKTPYLAKWYKLAKKNI